MAATVDIHVEDIRPRIYIDLDLESPAPAGARSYRCSNCGEKGILVAEDHTLLMCFLFLRSQIAALNARLRS